jgi:Golgi apparatus protein 1
MKLLVVAFFLSSFMAYANECAKDAKKYCEGVDPGKGQLARCLTDYKDNLSPACAKELKDYKDKIGKKNPCFEDLAEFCTDVPSDPENYQICLLKYENRLGPKCAADFKKKKGNLIVRNVCAQDIANSCYSELSGPDGAVTKCLIRNKKKLGGFCQKNLEKKITEMRKANPCFDETEKYCPKEVKFVDIQDCLSKKVKVLTPNCKKLVENEEGRMKANPCYRDLITHCKPGLNPKAQSDCLTLNEEHISNACKQFRVNESAKVKKMVELCEEDRLKLCKDAPFKDGAVAKCLRQNKTKVSPACKKLL